MLPVSTQVHEAWACFPRVHGKWRQKHRDYYSPIWWACDSRKHSGLWESQRGASTPLGHSKNLRRKLRVRSSSDEQGWQNLLGTESSIWFTDTYKELHMDLVSCLGWGCVQGSDKRIERGNQGPVMRFSYWSLGCGGGDRNGNDLSILSFSLGTWPACI